MTSTTLTGSYRLDATSFTETVEFDGVGPLDTDVVRAIATLWYLIAGLSYYKAGAATEIDLGQTPVGEQGRHFLRAALLDGLGEYAYANDLDLASVEITGGRSVTTRGGQASNSESLLIPFGGGIDSVVTVETVSRELPRRLFVVSPPSGRFAALEATAAVTGLEVVRATRYLDPAILQRRDGWFNGHVPISAMITLLAAVAAAASGASGVVMSNEHSASVPNRQWRGRDINHQWSKSHHAEVLVAAAVDEVAPGRITIASALRNRSELWVAQQFAALTAYHSVFRSCNRAFRQSASSRATSWCGECDKCLFIDLVLAPFMSRVALRTALGVEPLSDPARIEQLRTLVGVGWDAKPFECVGDPDECGVALLAVVDTPEWSHEDALKELARLVPTSMTMDEMLEPQGESRVPASWLR